jgi:hypothetical protein
MGVNDTDDAHDAARARDLRLENFAAELTRAVYPLVLRRGPKQAWIHVELALWRALAETVEQWASGPPAESPGEFDAWREGFLEALTERAFSIALDHGIEGPLLELELGLYRAFRLVMRRRGRNR